ncbi:PilZ domain-containing protein [Desulfobulbus alkaliphilus]|uniref:PilZ domain-containing protein n=1 Tax=Desulfobulbus alkaliphilus TaxID=869814 RepID=UPI001965801D|nr:PilZ domain-containing protein [Desulfobulbus alkaliphilus]MBM9535764.1 PilZ domain-containing protein [Desulfobulbus alkaliphilus]
MDISCCNHIVIAVECLKGIFTSRPSGRLSARHLHCPYPSDKVYFNRTVTDNTADARTNAHGSRDVLKKQESLAIVSAECNSIVMYFKAATFWRIMSATVTTPYIPEKRRHARVDCNRSVRIVGGQKVLGPYPIKNLSLGGIFVQADIDIPVGEQCRLQMRHTGSQASFILTFSGKILRREPDGIGLAFVEMERDSFMFLQTLVLYSSEDPTRIAENFCEDFASGSLPSC